MLEQAFKEAQKLPGELQDELAQQLLNDIENELKWQETFSDTDTDMDDFAEMAQAALAENDAGKTEEKGFEETAQAKKMAAFRAEVDRMHQSLPAQTFTDSAVLV